MRYEVLEAEMHVFNTSGQGPSVDEMESSGWEKVVRELTKSTLTLTVDDPQAIIAAPLPSFGPLPENWVISNSDIFSHRHHRTV